MNKYVSGLVSVIIPTYGRSDTLIRAIKSVEEQTYDKIEILVVDDNEPGSELSLNVESIIQGLKYENLYLVRQEKHINGAAARNAGIKVAKGEYIAFLDDDDMFLPNKIKTQVCFLKSLSNRYGGVSSRKIYIKHGEIDGISDNWKDNDRQNFDIITRRLNISTCTVLVRHDYLDEMGYFDERLQRNQEVQLLAFFTSKYKIKNIDIALTIIDCSNETNRPDSKRIMDIKNMYLESITPVLENYTEHQRNIIKAYNMLDVVRVYLREKHYGQALKLMMKIFKYPSVFAWFISFIIFRLKYKNSKVQLDHKVECYVNYMLNGDY